MFTLLPLFFNTESIKETFEVLTLLPKSTPKENATTVKNSIPKAFFDELFCSKVKIF